MHAQFKKLLQSEQVATPLKWLEEDFEGDENSRDNVNSLKEDLTK